jgi:transposase-like protein
VRPASASHNPYSASGSGSGKPIKKRDRKAALRFLRKAIGHNGTPEKITIDKSGANTAAIESHNAETKADIEMRQIKYLNNIVEQDHRAIKRRTRPMLGFKSFWSAAVTLACVELMHMIRKGQLMLTGELLISP